MKQYRKKRGDAGASDATVNREMATLSHMMRSLVRWKWIKPDALPAIEKTREDKKALVVLSEQQVADLMKAAVADQDGRAWLFVAFGLNTAMRHREILRVRYDQIDFDGRRIFIPLAKAGSREQPITHACEARCFKSDASHDAPHRDHATGGSWRRLADDPAYQWPQNPDDGDALRAFARKAYRCCH